jgi:hypothetical protein
MRVRITPEGKSKMQSMRAFMQRLGLRSLPVWALSVSVSLGASQLQVGQTATPSGAVGVPYSFTGVVTVSGGTAPYTYSVTSGSLPAGLKLTGNTVSGTPTAATTLPYPTITVKDSSSPQQTGSALVTLNVFPAGCIVIMTKSLPGGTIGQPYPTQTLQSSGGVKPITWSIRSGSLPPGLTLTGNTIGGTPTGYASTNGFDLQAKDSSGNSGDNTAQMPLSIAIQAGLQITSTSYLVGGVVGTPYSAQLTSSGGTGNVTWKLASGSSLVSGLSLSTSGLVSGTPTASTNGTGTFSVVAKDSASPAHTATASIHYIVNPSNGGFKVTTTGTPLAAQYKSYSFQLTSTGGTGAVTWSMTNSTTLPAGLKLAASGLISGMPTGNGGTMFWVQAKDSSPTPKTVDAFMAIDVSPNPLVITTGSFPAGVEGTAYSQQLSSSGGDGAVTWKLATGSSLVAGLHLSAAGLVSGTPTGSTPGHGSFSVVATDSAKPPNSVMGSINYVINPSNGGFKVTTDNLSGAILGQNYSKQLASSGGTGAVTWTAISGPNAQGLPTGLTLSHAGLIGGKPTALGNFAFWVQAKDSSPTPKTVNAYLDIIVNPLGPPTIANLSPNTAQAGGAGFTLTIDGTNFIAGAKAEWNGNALTTTYVSATELTAPVSASMIANPGSANVTVTTSAGTSAGFNFSIEPGQVAQCTNNGSGNARFKGSYAFQLSQIELSSGDLSMVIGVFTADGAGKITGQFDSNRPGSSHGDESGDVTGTYSVGADNRGMMTMAVPSGGSSGGTEEVNFCFALDSFNGGAVAGAGHMVEDDASGMVASGAFYAQGGTNFGVGSAKGSWVFGAQGGMESGNGQVGRAGAAFLLTLNGAGNVTAGEADVSLDQYAKTSGQLSNTYIHQTGITGTYTLASSGRGTMALIVPSSEPGGGTSNIVFYVAGPNQLVMMNADPGGENGGPVMSGIGFLRNSSATFNTATLSGTSISVDNAISNYDSSQPTRYVEVGIWTWDGKGGFDMSADSNDGGNVSLADSNTMGGTYSVDANGRATVTPSGNNGTAYIYLVGPNQAFGVLSNLGVDFLFFENQTVPAGGFTLDNFSGNYSLGTYGYSFEQEKAQSGVLSSSGGGSITGTADENQEGNVKVDKSVTGTYTASTTGRFIIMNGSTPGDAMYLVSPGKAYTINISGSTWEAIMEIDHQ